MKFCSECGSQVDDSAEFCSLCGQSTSDINSIYCLSCKEKIKKDSIFCEHCGSRVASRVTKVTPSSRVVKETPRVIKATPSPKVVEEAPKVSLVKPVLALIFSIASLINSLCCMLPYSFIGSLALTIIYYCVSAKLRDSYLFEMNQKGNGLTKSSKIISIIAIPVAIALCIVGLILTITGQSSESF